MIVQKPQLDIENIKPGMFVMFCEQEITASYSKEFGFWKNGIITSVEPFKLIVQYYCTSCKDSMNKHIITIDQIQRETIKILIPELFSDEEIVKLIPSIFRTLRSE